MSKMPLTKSEYLAGLQCPRMLWIMRHKSRHFSDPGLARLQRFQKSYEVEEFARQLFPGGTLIPWSEHDQTKRLEATQAALLDRPAALFEGVFESAGVQVQIDILVHDAANQGWKLYSVKSGTVVTDHALEDLAFQYEILVQKGINITAAGMIYLNKQYTRGQTLNLSGLFTITDLTAQTINKSRSVCKRIHDMQEVLQGEDPHTDIGPHCTTPYDCRARRYCWSHIPPLSVFQVSRLGGAEKFRLYHAGRIRQQDLLEEDLSPAQFREVQANLNQEILIRYPELKQFLSQLCLPVYYLDFECFQQAVPAYPGIKVYEQIPFQYSLHIHHTDGKLEHRDFLAEPGTDPRLALVQQLCADIPPGSRLVVYSASLEKTVIKRLAHTFPAHRKHLFSLLPGMIDLQVPFLKRWAYHYMQQGSHSIKAVLPAWVPDLAQAYNLSGSVHNGSEAMSTWVSLTEVTAPEQLQSLQQDLRAYCGLDTLAMVKIADSLKEYLINQFTPS